MSQKIVIVDYSMGNLHSVQKKLLRLKADVSISSDHKEIMEADKIILPGVGHFKKAVEHLKNTGLWEVLNEAVLVQKKPILGICLGMQLMAKFSEEGDAAGFGWLDASVAKFQIKDELKYKVPHMGWNQVEIVKESKLMEGIDSGTEMYFVHSYHFVTENRQDVLNETVYENKFTSAMEKNNIFGVQYHPEKSHDSGEKLMNNFINLLL